MTLRARVLLSLGSIMTIACFAPAWFVRIVPASSPPLGSGAITVRPVGHGTGWPTGASPTGAWSGPPQVISGPIAVGQLHGNTVYYWYLKGMKGVVPDDPNTMILATDDWRWRTNYQRSSDTIEITASDGRRFRRQGTPVYSVVAAMAPSVVKQASGIPGPQARLKLPNDAGTLSLEVRDISWMASHGDVTLPLGGSIDATAEPHYNSPASGHAWQDPSGLNPSVVSEVEVETTTFSITVPGYSDDLSNQSVFIYPAVPPTPDATITLIHGVGLRKQMTVSYGAGSRTFENGYNQIFAPSGQNGEVITVPPEVPPTVIQYAILYVPGDTWEMPAKMESSGGK